MNLVRAGDCGLAYANADVCANALADAAAYAFVTVIASADANADVCANALADAAAYAFASANACANANAFAIACKKS